jgi:hypothetical protein
MSSAESGSVGVPPAAKPVAELNLVRLLYNTNPFYALSAVLVLIGLHQLTHDPSVVGDPYSVAAASWLYFVGIAGYAALLAGVAVFIIRRGAVWDDARTILVTLLLLMAAMSVSFDHLLLTQPGTMLQMLTAGAILAIGITEGVLRGAGIYLSSAYRIPLYLSYGLLFLYPAAITYTLDTIGGADSRLGLSATRWLTFLFPTASACVGLTLLPAAMAGPKSVAGNRSPWRWAWFPWSAFVILGVALALRSWYLTVSFDPRPKWDTAFAGYFLLPFGWVVALLLFENGRSVGNRAVQYLALAVTMALLPLGLPGPNLTPPQREFLIDFMATLGPPARWALGGGAILSAWFALRGLTAGWYFAIALVAASGWVGGMTTAWRFVAEAPSITGPILAAVLAGLIALLRPGAAQWGLAAAAIVLPLFLQERAIVHAVWSGAMSVHLLLFALLAIGWIYRNSDAGEVVQAIAAWALLAVIVFVTFSDRLAEMRASGVVGGYLVAVAVVSFSYFRMTQNHGHLVVAVIALLAAGWQAMQWVWQLLSRLRNPYAILMVLGGFASLAVGLAISLRKAKPSTPEGTTES